MPMRPQIHGAEQTVNRRKQYDRDRAADHRFYNSTAWRRVRAVVLARDPVCVLCLKLGRVTISTIADHIKERKAHPELALDADNCRGTCSPCHSQRTRLREQGKLMDTTETIIVHGPPASGKDNARP
jgi:5-methylcytosine-specific restriction protein A